MSVCDKVAECQNACNYFEKRNCVSAGNNINVRCSSACEWRTAQRDTSHRLGIKKAEGERRPEKI